MFLNDPKFLFPFKNWRIGTMIVHWTGICKEWEVTHLLHLRCWVLWANLANMEVCLHYNETMKGYNELSNWATEKSSKIKQIKLIKQILKGVTHSLFSRERKIDPGREKSHAIWHSTWLTFWPHGQKGRSVSRNGQFSGQLWKQLETFVPLTMTSPDVTQQPNPRAWAGKLFQLSGLPTSVGKEANRVCNHFSIFRKNFEIFKICPKKMSDSLNFPFPIGWISEAWLRRRALLGRTGREPYKNPHPTHTRLHFCDIIIVLYDYVLCVMCI